MESVSAAAVFLACSTASKDACLNAECCAGKLMAFDKHLNLLLSDVHETYVVRWRVQHSKDVQKMVPVRKLLSPC